MGMKEVGIRELRQNLSALLDMVKRGSEIVVNRPRAPGGAARAPSTASREGISRPVGLQGADAEVGAPAFRHAE